MVLGTTLACAALAVIGWFWFAGAGARHAAAGASADEVKNRMEEGSRALSEGNFQLAAEELQQADESLKQHPDTLPPAGRRHLHRMLRQAALLADLLSDSLEEILGRAAGQEDREWQATFNRRYKGKAVVFEAEVRRDAARKYHLNYSLRLEREPVHIDLDELELLQKLPVDTPQRMLFGARLASIRREAPGPTWVIRFVPDSGVLLTHPGAAAACGLPAGSDDMEAILEKQAGWVRNQDGS